MDKNNKVVKCSINGKLNDILTEINTTAKDLGYSAYLVGGTVRDIILGNKAGDLDIVIEGDAVELAQTVCKRHGYEVKVYQRFKTAAARLPWGWKVDFATARGERYASPGALPDVCPSNLYDDLYRRDFSINALALSLDDFTLVDYFGGLADIQNRTMRILHDKSFVDDPTRIFRCLRFKTRYDFKIETNTRSLLIEAVDAGYPLLLSLERLGSEFEHMFSEKSFPEIFRQMQEFGILDLLFGDDCSNEDVCCLLEHAPGRQEGRSSYIALVLLDRIDSNLLRMILRKHKKYHEQLNILREREKKTGNRNKIRLLDYAQLSGLFTGIDRVVFQYLLRLEQGIYRENLKRYIEEVEEFPLHINGEELKRMGLQQGPRFGSILEEAKKTILKNRIYSRNEQMEVLRNTVKGCDIRWDDRA